MENYSLQKKLIAYSAAAVPFFAMPHHAEGQILYTDVSPDDTLPMCDTFALDLNNDGSMDFMLGVGKHIFNYWHACMIMKEGSGENFIAGIATSYTSTYGVSSHDYFKLPFKLDYLDPIGASVNWVSPLAFAPAMWCNGAPLPWHSQAVFNFWSGSSFYQGNWNTGPTEGYLGLKINVGNQNFYGWARLVVDSSANWMIVEDYAIDTIPDQTIGAGQCLCPPAHVESSGEMNSEILVAPNPSSNELRVSARKNIPSSSPAIIDLQGREQNIYWRDEKSEWIADVSSLANGAYILELQISSRLLREKIIIQH